MLIWRVITAIILIPLVIGALFTVNAEIFRWIVIAIFGLVAREWGMLCQFKQRWQFFVFLIGFVAGAVFLPFNQIVLWVGAISWLIPLYCCVAYSRSQGQSQGLLKTPIMRALMGWVFLISATQALITLQSMERGAWWILALLLLIWSSDIFAYFSGKLWGKHRLAVHISPNKTQEGLVGGILGAMVVAEVGYYTLAPGIGWFLIAFVTILLGVLGDLFESLLKRLAKVKDSGQLLPGHGGAFDRLDSLIAALPFYTLCLSYRL